MLIEARRRRQTDCWMSPGIRRMSMNTSTCAASNSVGITSNALRYAGIGQRLFVQIVAGLVEEMAGTVFQPFMHDAVHHVITKACAWVSSTFLEIHISALMKSVSSSAGKDRSPAGPGSCVFSGIDRATLPTSSSGSRPWQLASSTTEKLPLHSRRHTAVGSRPLPSRAVDLAPFVVYRHSHATGIRAVERLQTNPPRPPPSAAASARLLISGQ